MLLAAVVGSGIMADRLADGEHAMFGQRILMLSTHTRTGSPQIFSEFVATFGLLSVIWGCSRRRSATVPFAVAAYITAAYSFTASTSFANPAVTIARGLTDTFAGIRPTDVPGFIVGQLAGAAAATCCFDGWSRLYPRLPRKSLSHTLRTRCYDDDPLCVCA